MHRRRGIDRRVEIVAERGAQRLFVAFLDRDMVDHRRPQAAGLERQHLGEGLGLGLQPLHALFGFGGGIARGLEFGARDVVRGLGGNGGGFRLGERGLRALRPRRWRRRAAVASSRSMASISPAILATRSACSRAAFSKALRWAVRSASAVVSSENIFSAALSAPSASATRASTPLRRPALSRASARMVSSSAASRASACSASAAMRCSRSMSAANCTSRRSSSAMRSLARASSRSRSCSATLRRCSAAPARASASRSSGSPAATCVWRLEASACASVRLATSRRQVLGVLGLGDVVGRGGPAQVIERRLHLAHLRRHGAVADRLLGLLLQAVDLGGELADDVFDAQQIGLRRFEPQLGLVAAGMQAGNAGGLFQHAAALLGLGLDDFADAALMHQRRRAGAGRGVGEQDLHVAGAHFLAVDAVGGAGLALDAPRDVDLILVVEGGRRRAVGIVDQHRHFGIVAGRAVGGAGENHVVHGRGAHGFVRGFAHHPAQRFDQVRFAAAVRPDHAGQARLDQEIGRLDKRLEADQAQPRKLHASGLIDPERHRPD